MRRLRDPLLLGALPITFGLLTILGYWSSWPIGFDFRGTLWEPASALLDGLPVYPEPTRDAIVIGNPTVYPPLSILLALPLALLPVTVASWLWFAVLAACVVAGMGIVRLRDWRCHVLAVSSPVVVHGLYYGNLTILLLLPLAVAWRYRDRARIAGIAVGLAVAAKLFIWPLALWLLLTRRFRAAAWALASGIVFVLVPWALIGFQGFTDYPALLNAVQDVYAIRSLSLSTVVGALGASTDVAVAAAGILGLACIVVAAWVVGRADGDRRAFAVLVATCILATPIVWPNYCALLFVPIAVTWPRLAPAWFFGYAVWLAGAVSPKPVADDVCCRPPDVTEQAWAASHTDPVLWFAAGATGVTLAVMILTARNVRGEASCP
jgi:hypothetical protein